MFENAKQQQQKLRKKKKGEETNNICLIFAFVSVFACGLGDEFPRKKIYFLSIFNDIRSIELIECEQRVCTAAGNECFEEDTKHF